MKFNVRLGAAGVTLFAALGVASAAQAAPVTQTAEARAEIVRALTLVKDTDLDFGQVAVAGAGTVVVDPDGTVSTCSTNLTCYGTTSGAKFDVTTGSIGKTLNVTLPSNLILRRGGGAVGNAADELELSAYTTNAAGSGPYTVTLAADASGSNGVATFSVGGSLAFDGSEVEGVYTGTIQVSVDYN